MKNLSMCFALALMLCACKKEKSKPTEDPNTPITIWATLNDQGNSLKLDSTKISVYEGSFSDTVLVEAKYTDKTGRVTFSLGKSKSYQVYAKSRTYKFSADTDPHFYQTKIKNKQNALQTTLIVADYLDKDTYNYPMIETMFDTPVSGYGCTSYYIADPAE